MKTFGTVTYSEEYNRWEIECEPHVAIKLKAVFSKIRKSQFGVQHITATEENSRDLEWFLERYPMEVKRGDLLTERARAYDFRMERVTGILDGTYEPPSYEMALPPRNYQKVAAAVVWQLHGLLLGDQLGLGKTVSSLTVLSNPDCLPAVVVCPTHLPIQWQREVKRFLPKLRTHICQKGRPYPIGKPDIVILNYHKLSGWAEVLGKFVRTLIFDEVQELRRRDSNGIVTNKYAAASYLSSCAEYRLGNSATPIYNYGGEFHNIFECIAPGLLGSKDEFNREWCVGYGYHDDKARIQDPQAFGTYLLESGRMLIRTKKDVGRELPTVNQVIHDVETDSSQLEKIEDAASELANFIVNQKKADGFSVMRASQELSNTLRLATGVAKAPYVASFVDMLLTSNPGEKVVLFGWHRAVYDLWAARLWQYKPAWFTGTESPKKKQAEIDRFLDDSSCRVLIMSLRSGSGVDGLQRVCSQVVFGELDWSPGVHEQCVGRIHRDGQEEPVFVYYLTATDGADPIMMDVLGVKKRQLEGVIDPKGQLVKNLQIDPNHVKRLAADYLKNRGDKVRSKIIEGGRLDAILKSRPKKKKTAFGGLRLKKGWK